MCWRQMTNSTKCFLTIFFYVILYNAITYVITPETPVLFIDSQLAIGNKFILMFLDAECRPYSNREGADVFASRRCDYCFLTNDRGFLPLDAYDAILMHRDRRLLEESHAINDPEKIYLLETSEECLDAKLRGCEPSVTSLSTKLSYNLCELCDALKLQLLSGP